MSWKNSVSMSIGVSACPSIDTFVVEQEPSKRSPIDDFYSSTGGILTKINPDYIATYGDDITGLLLVGFISATENYFRDILGAILEICPVARQCSSDEKVQLGSLLWGSKELHNRSAFEFLAFSNAKNVKETFSKFVSHTIVQNGVWHNMLPEYDKLCELRHAVVHSGHIIAGKNALKLSLRSSKKELKLNLDYARVQSAGRVCTALVQSANNELFELMVSRWAVKWRQLPSWSEDQERLIREIYNTFQSKRDRANKTISNRVSYPAFLAAVKIDFNL